MQFLKFMLVTIFITLSIYVCNKWLISYIHVFFQNSIESLGKNGNSVKVENIHVKKVNFKGTTNGARIKTWQVIIISNYNVLLFISNTFTIFVKRLDWVTFERFHSSISPYNQYKTQYISIKITAILKVLEVIVDKR